MRSRLVVHAALIAFLGWLYGGDLLRASRLSHEAFAAMASAPNVPLAVVGLAIAVLGLVAVFKQSLFGRFAGLAAMVLVFDFAVLWSGREPQSVNTLCGAAVAGLTDAANELATTDGVPTDAAGLARVVEDLGAPPFFLAGERRSSWGVEVKRDCAGPFVEPGSLTPGTLVYCVSPDARQAWVTVVTLSGAFGERRMVSTESLVGQVRAPHEEPSAQPPPTMWDEGVPAER